ncbi:MAG: glutamate--tRNA ligase [Bacilli bacterium]|nr:glutamate--tRNA ligase [Bacilli bacterium]
MEKTRTRFAPSPTGYMHIGNLRTAIFEYLIAKHDNGDFLLRIEDTDQNRKVEGAVDFIYNTLSLCGFKIDEGPFNEGKYGPYIQSERLDLYKKYAHELVEKGAAYYCFCDEERLERLREVASLNKQAFMYDGCCRKLTKEEAEEKIKNGESYVIRQKMPKEGQTVVKDLVYGEVVIDNSVLEDQILLKSDGYPTYNFANVVDDHLMEITHVVRGKEYLDQTAKYNLLYEAFGWEKPIYAHVAMVLGEDGTKLSKRNGDASFMDLYNDGYLPEAIVNYLVLLGWSPESNQEVFSMEELIKEFNPNRISKSSSQYDVKKLNWFNAIYIKNMELDKYVEFVLPFLKEGYDLSGKSEEWIKHLLSIYQSHISYGKQIVDEVKLFFEDEVSLDEECQEFIKQEGIDKTISVFKDEINAISDWNVENITNAINNTKEKAEVKGKMLYMPIRIKVSGIMHGPELPDTIYLLGKDTVLKRLG